VRSTLTMPREVALQGSRGNGTTTPTSDSSSPQRAAMPTPAKSSPVQDLLDLGDLLGAPPASVRATPPPPKPVAPTRCVSWIQYDGLFKCAV
jgi:hypothetical protein